MAAVNEWIVREYFEQLGYLVHQPTKHVATGRHEESEREGNLMIMNPCVKDHVVPKQAVWTSEDMKGIARAVVCVRGWHTGRFYLKNFEHDSDLLGFVDGQALRLAHKLVGPGPIARVLCLSKLPASEELEEKTLRYLREKGVDGVITFSTMLAELIHRVDGSRNYEKSDLLQIIRILKIYDFFKDYQMELFGKKKPRIATDRKKQAPPEEVKPAPPPAE